ncbi:MULTISPECIES: PfkB family carbohydrate kinase [Bradyrhizobium]
MNARPLMFFGTTNLDLCFNVERLPTPGESLMGALTRNPGGKGANQAVAAARLGLKPHFYTHLGDDDAGQSLLKSLMEAGVRTEAITICAGEVSGLAAFAASLAQRLPLKEAVRKALAVAALCVTRRGRSARSRPIDTGLISLNWLAARFDKPPMAGMPLFRLEERNTGSG